MRHFTKWETEAARGKRKDDKAMNKSTRVLHSLPATVTELAALEGTTVRRMNAMLCWLRGLGLVRRTDRRGDKQPGRGPWPHLWVRK